MKKQWQQHHRKVRIIGIVLLSVTIFVMAIAVFPLELFFLSILTILVLLRSIEKDFDTDTKKRIHKLLKY